MCKKVMRAKVKKKRKTGNEGLGFYAGVVRVGLIRGYNFIRT